MTCDDALGPLNDRLDGELEPDVARALADHLAACAACRGLAADLERLRVVARALPAEIEPPRDLWDEIAARIAPQVAVRRRSWTGVWLLAAAALLALGSSGLTAWWLDREPPPPAVVAAADWQRDLDAATADLRAALDGQRGALDPATLAVIEENLRIIDRAVDDTRRALETDPGDETLRRSLVAVNEQRITLLRRALALPRGGITPSDGG